MMTDEDAIQFKNMFNWAADQPDIRSISVGLYKGFTVASSKGAPEFEMHTIETKMPEMKATSVPSGRGKTLLEAMGEFVKAKNNPDRGWT